MKSKSISRYFWFFFFLSFLFYAGHLVISIFFIDETLWKYLSIGIGTFLNLYFTLFLYFVFQNYFRNKASISKNLNIHLESLISKTGVGLIVLNKFNEIIWASDFIELNFGKGLIGQKLSNISKDIHENLTEKRDEFVIEVNKNFYEVLVFPESNALLVKNITLETKILEQYRLDNAIVGELEIDNFQNIQLTVSEEELYKIQTAVSKMLEQLSENHEFIYRQTSGGKYYLFLKQRTLDKFIKSNFSFFEQIRSLQIQDLSRVSFSVGFAVGDASFKVKKDLAKDALLQAQARGGDQVALMDEMRKPTYFASKIDSAHSISRVRIKNLTFTIEELLSSKDIKNVIIYGHREADLDAVGAALGLYDLACEYKKVAYIQNTTIDSTTLVSIDSLLLPADKKIFISPKKANKLTNDSTLVFIVDTCNLDRIENESLLKFVNPKNIFIFDHHRLFTLPKEILDQNVYIDSSASSTSEIVTELLQFVNRNLKIKRRFAQMLLNGIYLDTKNFTKNTTSRTFQAAAWLERNGALSAKSVESLKIPSEYAKVISNLIASSNEVKPGFFLAATDEAAPSEIISIVADEILRVSGRKAAFVIARIPGKKEYKLSARSIDTNVQFITEKVGGGGTFSSAAATSRESLEDFKSNIIQAIVSNKES